MVEFVINNEALHKSLLQCDGGRDNAKFALSTPMSHFGFHVKDKKLDIVTRRNGMGVKISIPVGDKLEIVQKGSFAVCGDKLVNLISKFPKGKITILAKPSDSGATIFFYMPNAAGEARKSDKSCHSVSGILEEGDIPKLPEKNKGQSLEVDTKLLLTMIKKTSFAASTDNIGLNNLKAVRLEFDEKGSKSVAADGQQLAIYSDSSAKYEKAVCLVFAADAEVLTNVFTPEGKINMTIGEERVIFEREDMVVLLDTAGSPAEYVNYEKYTSRTDADATATLKIDKKKFESVFARLKEVADFETTFFFGKDERYAQSNTGTIWATEDLSEAIEFSGSDTKYVFNYKHLITMIKASEKDVLNARLFGTDTPIDIAVGDNYRYLILPLTLEEQKEETKENAESQNTEAQEGTAADSGTEAAE